MVEQTPEIPLLIFENDLDKLDIALDSGNYYCPSDIYAGVSSYYGVGRDFKKKLHEEETLKNYPELYKIVLELSTFDKGEFFLDWLDELDVRLVHISHLFLLQYYQYEKEIKKWTTRLYIEIERILKTTSSDTTVPTDTLLKMQSIARDYNYDLTVKQ